MLTTRWRFGLLACWSAVIAAAAYAQGRHVVGSDWTLFRDVSRSLSLHVYALRPDVQVGPPALALEALLQHVAGNIAVLVVIIGLGLVAVWALDGVAACSPRVLLGVDVLLLTVWAADLGGWGHLEDALALTGLLVAARCVKSDRWWVAGLCVGLAVACKPWAVVAAPVLLGLRHSRTRACALAGVVALVPWLPFLLADGRTVNVSRYTWRVVDGSGLYALGFGPTTPSWLRPTQLVLGVAVAVGAARRSWVTAPLAGLAARVALDPLTWAYYGVGPVAVAALVDVTSSRRVPVWTSSAFVVEYVVGPYAPPSLAGFTRLAWSVVVISSLLAVPRQTPQSAAACRELVKVGG